MKMHLSPLAFVLLLFACNEAQPTQPQALTADQPAAPAPPPVPAGPDMFVGDFVAADTDPNQYYSYSNKITIAIESIKDGVLKGFSVVAGNSRPFEGPCTEKDGVVSATVREPGDDQYDGEFKFQYRRDSQTVSGTWKAYKKHKKSVSQRTYTLSKRVFKYDPSQNMTELGVMDEDMYNSFRSNEGDENTAEFLTADVVKFNASNTVLRKEDIENMYRGDLEVTRNAIYARHGYSFKNRRMRYVFDRHVEWYMPVSTDVTKELTELELKNIDLLKRYEKHAEVYYDSFGR